jgi:hypothetical protein
MANFAFNTANITPEIREPAVEGLLQDLPRALADTIGSLVPGVNDVGGELHVNDDTEYEILMTQTMVLIKKKLK